MVKFLPSPSRSLWVESAETRYKKWHTNFLRWEGFGRRDLGKRSIPKETGVNYWNITALLWVIMILLVAGLKQINFRDLFPIPLRRPRKTKGLPAQDRVGSPFMQKMSLKPLRAWW
jgi:hypothetical protein